MKRLQNFLQQLGADEAGARMYALMERLYPICRSITGPGVRQTLDILQEFLPLQRNEVPTGTQVFDWTVPNEWTIRSAWIKDPAGACIVDFKRCNLHVVSYSTPVHGQMSLAELKKHLHSDPEHPDWIPYRTSYYQESWGFCLTHRQLLSLQEGEYEVCIDADLLPGSLSYAECVIQGNSPTEVLLFAHTCHPSLCNDNLSGVVLLASLGQYLRRCHLNWTYRLVFAPATIGSITWLSRNQEGLDRIKAGLIVSVAGDPGSITYKRSRHGSALIDRAAAHIVRQGEKPGTILPFSPWGYDERQFCSPGINLPIGRITRSPNGAYAEYHTSADNLDLVQAGHLQDSLHRIMQILHVLESDRRYQNLAPFGEPQLGRRGLYRMMGGYTNIGALQHALLWVLNYSDGLHSLLDISEMSGLDFPTLQHAAELAEKSGLLSPQPLSLEHCAIPERNLPLHQHTS
ncbi:DUF4910 domain-containing protein [Alicycliphilus denitrificans]|uniref:DUF4910 domain-containing protein n=1 Tax=Alicycliphilus denitrificans TaxID=179636 RepID=UPI00384C7979